MKRAIILLLTAVLLLIAFGALAQPPPAMTSADQLSANVAPSPIMFATIHPELIAGADIQKESSLNSAKVLAQTGPNPTEANTQDIVLTLASSANIYEAANTLTGMGMIATAYMVSGSDI